MPPDPLPPPPEHWSPDEFRRRGHDMIDRISDYWSRLQDPDPPWPVASARTPGQTAAMLPPGAPERPEPWDAVLADVERVILPGLAHWQSPSFFGYFPANVSPPAVLGELLSAGLGVQGMLWATSPACTEIETRMLDWMCGAAGLPDAFLSSGPGGGVIAGTASEATLVAMIAARDRAPGGPPVVYASSQAHSSVTKAAMIAGLGRDGARLIDVDTHGRMIPSRLQDAMNADQAAGRRPCFVTATLGTTGTMALDPLRAIGEVCRRHQAWLHVDAAYAGSALICPEQRSMLDGVEHVHSLAFNPHKWLLTNFDCGLLWTRDRAALIGALSITPEYLRNAATDSGAVIDYRDWQVPLGRRFRALKLWFVLRAYGLDGLRAHIRYTGALSDLFASLVGSDRRFEIPVPPALGLVCFRLRGNGHATRQLHARLNASGRLFLSHTVLPPDPNSAGADDRTVLRMALGGGFTREAHVRRAWEEIRRQASELERSEARA